MIPVLLSKRRWECPNCATVDETGPLPNRYHQCPGLGGLLAPLLPAGTRAKVEVHEREDYIASEDVALHQGRPVMSVVTTRDDGQDVMVFAPTARGDGHGLDE